MRIVPVQTKRALPKMLKNSKLSLPKGSVVPQKSLVAKTAAIATSGVLFSSGDSCSDYEWGEPPGCTPLLSF